MTTTTTTTTTTNVYADALAILRERGWKRQGTNDETGSVCILSALADAQGLLSWINVPAAQHDVLARTICAQHPEMDNGYARDYLVWIWNDEHAKDQHEVEQILEKAAANYADD
jgi:hypothetical protein